MSPGLRFLLLAVLLVLLDCAAIYLGANFVTLKSSSSLKNAPKISRRIENHQSISGFDFVRPLFEVLSLLHTLHKFTFVFSFSVLGGLRVVTRCFVFFFLHKAVFLLHLIFFGNGGVTLR